MVIGSMGNWSISSTRDAGVTDSAWPCPVPASGIPGCTPIGCRWRASGPWAPRLTAQCCWRSCFWRARPRRRSDRSGPSPVPPGRSPALFAAVGFGGQGQIEAAAAVVRIEAEIRRPRRWRYRPVPSRSGCRRLSPITSASTLAANRRSSWALGPGVIAIVYWRLSLASIRLILRADCIAGVG